MSEAISTMAVRIEYMKKIIDDQKGKMDEYKGGDQSVEHLSYFYELCFEQDMMSRTFVSEESICLFAVKKKNKKLFQDFPLDRQIILVKGTN
ncbi:hypothetical protein MA16_Dca001104 [Dendrobium catenatum]|uniref:Uncharacterized protein n=1 Tax=Dendrobium catenatum TaxID=906689 RepID=A0A2I0WLG0_9ASPA|nr:hypothetical protein MA16_Dca001104 [Dendrobium catenatum]